jgi:hypothetical protein
MTGRSSAQDECGPSRTATTTAPAPKRNLWKLAASGVLAVMVAMALGVAHAASAQALGGTGDPCSVKDVSVTKLPYETLYVYQVDCPGKPLGYFGAPLRRSTRSSATGVPRPGRLARTSTVSIAERLRSTPGRAMRTRG